MSRRSNDIFMMIGENLERRRRNKDIDRDLATYSDFLLYINPSSSIWQKILGVIINFFGQFMPVINIYLMFRLFNSFFIPYRKPTGGIDRYQTWTTRDRRYKGGYRVTDGRYITDYMVLPGGAIIMLKPIQRIYLMLPSALFLGGGLALMVKSHITKGIVDDTELYMILVYYSGLILGLLISILHFIYSGKRNMKSGVFKPIPFSL